MPDESALRTVDVARESGYSVQQVRDLERLGVIPAATRSSNGYRAYAPVHVRALRAYRGLAGAVGPVAARQLMADLWTRTVTEAAAAINAVHVGLARERDEVLRAQQALWAIESEAAHYGAVETEAAHHGAAEGADTMTITELAAALGVRTSTLRFWEREGLVAPERVTSLRARRYDAPAIGAARIVAALRGSGYGIPAVRDIIDSLHSLQEGGGSERVRHILVERLDRIGARSVELLRAGADLAAVLDSLTPARDPAPAPA
ncbi:MerR family transcriptional regulator [Streptomyces sp. NBC_00006]|uniref:MerR family transcriptional regulator n=1 Tax=Streptomyces sp. NBC_00006 TaxID=2975619 RepID=UPI002252F8DC|nr:MerR family transcriptional regulator [Streptomyces sp. NBC_00006]MCX5537280.1 MerR family transcriptional regulator [Streptomyces sp. NBC_00006]